MPGTNTQTLTTIFGDTADAIRAKDGTSAPIYPADFATKIAAIPDAFDWSQIKTGITIKNSSQQATLDLRGMDTTTWTSMTSVFSGCSDLVSLDLRGWSTAPVRYFDNMFLDCSHLITLDLGMFNTGNAVSFNQMFNRCASLTSINLSSWDTNSVTTMNSTFGSCSSLEAIIWCIDSTSVMPLKAAATSCGLSSTQCYGSGTGYIYVRDSLVSQYKASTNFSDANVVDHITGISNLPAALQTLYNIDPNDYQ